MNELLTLIYTDSKINFEPETKKLIENGLMILEQYPSHPNGLKHTKNIIHNMLIVKNRGLFREANYEVIIISAVWHDIWKIGQPQTFFQTIYGLFFEGKEASKLFLEEAKQYNLNSNLTNQINYVIKKHSTFNFQRTSLESKIFHDLDHLEEETEERRNQKLITNNFLIRLLYKIQEMLPNHFYFSVFRSLKD